jgi:hypothetical protein
MHRCSCFDARRMLGSCLWLGQSREAFLFHAEESIPPLKRKGKEQRGSSRRWAKPSRFRQAEIIAPLQAARGDGL